MKTMRCSQILAAMMLSLIFSACGGSAIEEDLLDPEKEDRAANEQHLICGSSFLATLHGPEYQTFRIRPSERSRYITIEINAKFDPSVGIHLASSVEREEGSQSPVIGANDTTTPLAIGFEAEPNRVYHVEVGTTFLDNSDSAERQYTLGTACDLWSCVPNCSDGAGQATAGQDDGCGGTCNSY